MRAIKLSVTAFGPYLEKQVIDFELLGDESIFLITGPTGAGKTTVFDAICYALYGRASGSDRDQDSLRSHFAAIDEPTEVVFQFALNNCVYEIIRNPKQQKKKERGDGYTEEPAKAILYEIVNGEKQLLSSRIKDVNETIEEKLGFDYEQFRKMVLIPQGEFRKLISENSREREAILQKIFRTHFYEKMTDELKIQAKELETQMKKLEADMEYELSKIDWQHVEIEESDTNEVKLDKLRLEIEETENRATEQNEAIGKQREKLKLVEDKLRKASIIEEKFKEQQALLVEQQRLDQQKATMAEQKARLHLARTAQQLVPLEEQAAARQAEWQRQAKRLQEQEANLAQLNKEYGSVKQKYEEAISKESERETLKEEIKRGKEQLQLVNTYLELTKKMDKLEQKKIQANDKLTQTQMNLQKLEAKMKELETQLAEETTLTKAYYETRDALIEQEDRKKKLTEYQIESHKLIGLRQQYATAKRKYQEKQEHIKHLKAKYDKLQLAQNEQFAGWLAHELVPGEPCPVCGSTHHPNKAVQDTFEHNMEELEELKALIQKQELEFDAVQQDFVNHKTNGQTQRSYVDKLQAELETIFPGFANEQVQTVEANVTNEIDSIKRKLEGITTKLKEIKSIQDKKVTYQNKETELKQTFDLISKHMQELNDELLKTSAKAEELVKQLPNEVEDPTTFTNLVIEKEKQYEHVMVEWEQLKSSYEKINELRQKQTTVLEQVQGFEQETNDSYQLQKQKFLTAISENGFANIEEYHKVKLSLEQQKQLETEIETYEATVKRIQFRLEELNEQLEKVERVNLEALEAEANLCKEELQQMQERLLTIQSKQKHDEESRQRLKTIMQNNKVLETDYYIVGSLADLSSGNNALRLSFERYVLASFLDEILLQANVRLDRMTDHRYQLVRSGEVAKRGAQSGLDLEVMDHHTGITRSVKTLSGGEGFKAALSLALGLADVVQAHAGGVQLDTLFIDEGFGTLDEISLQQAIDCLKDLQESNRLLGIISHVPALKSEIHTKLVIEPSHRGSKLAFRFGN
ncbi:AAA family ATPase [Ornithinibacillus sp. FSL M8-0202]|uniref:AAA family ATPase n=1 Tax=Ornithinibacillus sp. FSL M8-0202 TaxID=2921616 RepID=UPI0030D0DFF1